MATAGFCVALCAIAISSCLLLSSSSSSSQLCLINTRHDRTAYHFQPAKYWQNDPNGPMYNNGIYHLFYQYNPHGPLWGIGNLSWGHSVSGDLVNWAALDTALDPTAPFDANGCWSGSATVLPTGFPVILYTGIDADHRQVQNIAFPKNPSDPLLREWTKPSYNPVIPLPADIPADEFRDPTTAWPGSDGMWRIAVSAEVDGEGSTLVYRSADFFHWERSAAPLHATRGAGRVECPDFFPVSEDGTEGLDMSANGAGVRHVLKVSVMSTLQDYYMVGRYDEASDAFIPGEDGRGDDYRNWRRIDHGHVYGSKTFFDARKKRRVLWAWANESDSQSDDVDKGWSGVQTFPRALWLDSDGKQLVQWPIEEIETLKRNRVGLQAADMEAGGLRELSGIEAAQADVEVVFEIPSLDGAEAFDPEWLADPQRLCGEKGASVQGGVGPFGLLVMASGDLQEHTAVFFRLFKHHDKHMVLMCTDLTRSSTRAGVYKPPYGGFVDVDIENDRRISLRTLIDHSVVESFGGRGRTCITARVYPEHTAASNSHLYAFNNGSRTVTISRLEAWELASATVNVGDDGLIEVN